MKEKSVIIAEFREAHDVLSRNYYSGKSDMTKAEFDNLHGLNWDNMRAELIAEGHIIVEPPPRDLEAEIDALTRRLDNWELS